MVNSAGIPNAGIPVVDDRQAHVRLLVFTRVGLQNGFEAEFFDDHAGPIRVSWFMNALYLALQVSQTASGGASRKEPA